MLVTLSLIHCVKLLQPFSLHVSDQNVPTYNVSFTTIIHSHGCKAILFSLLQAKKIADAVLLYVFNIGFPAPPLQCKHSDHLCVVDYKETRGVALAMVALLLLV